MLSLLSDWQGIHMTKTVLQYPASAFPEDFNNCMQKQIATNSVVTTRLYSLAIIYEELYLIY